MNKPVIQSHKQYYYALQAIILFATIEIVSSAGSTKNTHWFFRSDADEDDAAAGMAVMLVPFIKPVGANDIKVTLEYDDGTPAQSSDEMTIPGLTAVNQATWVTASAALIADCEDVTDATLDGTDHGQAGDVLEIWGVPSPTDDTNWTRMRYIRSDDVTPGGSAQPVPDGMDPQRVSVAVRPTHSFSMGAQYTDNNTGLPKLRGHTMCIKVEVHVDGGPVVSEYHVLGSAIIMDLGNPASDNADMMSNVTGVYRRNLVYAP